MGQVKSFRGKKLGNSYYLYLSTTVCDKGELLHLIGGLEQCLYYRILNILR